MGSHPGTRAWAPWLMRCSGDDGERVTNTACFGIWAQAPSSEKETKQFYPLGLCREQQCSHVQWDWSWQQQPYSRGLCLCTRGSGGTKGQNYRELKWIQGGTAVGWLQNPKSYCIASAFLSYVIRLGFISKNILLVHGRQAAKLQRSWFRWECPSRTIGAIYKKMHSLQCIIRSFAFHTKIWDNGSERKWRKSKQNNFCPETHLLKTPSAFPHTLIRISHLSMSQLND